MRYMLLIHGDESGWDELSDAERDAQYERHGTLRRRMESMGTTWPATRSPEPRRPKVARVRGGETLRPGPGPLVRGRDPGSRKGTIEVRPILEGS